jgi:hypothetical protein
MAFADQALPASFNIVLKLCRSLEPHYLKPALNFQTFIYEVLPWHGAQRPILIADNLVAIYSL